jgi:hypothetical protein
MKPKDIQGFTGTPAARKFPTFEKGLPMSNTALIDSFGILKAQIADLEAKEKDLRNKLIAEFGEGAFEGAFFRVTISKTVRETLDMGAVRKHLSRQFIKANTKETEVTIVKAGARNGVVAEVAGREVVEVRVVQ